MAWGKVFACSHCNRDIEAWDEGDPYYFDGQGEKRYAFHPDPQRELCTGIDLPVLCLNCGAESMNDSASPITQCPQCAGGEIVDMWALDDKLCPYCKAGTFHADETAFMVS